MLCRWLRSRRRRWILLAADAHTRSVILGLAWLFDRVAIIFDEVEVKSLGAVNEVNAHILVLKRDFEDIEDNED